MSRVTTDAQRELARERSRRYAARHREDLKEKAATDVQRELARERNRRYYARHREEVLERRREHLRAMTAEDREQQREKNRLRYKQTGRERKNEYQRAYRAATNYDARYREENRDRINAYHRQRYANNLVAERANARENSRRAWEARPEHYREMSRARLQRDRLANPEKHRRYAAAHYAKWREVINEQQAVRAMTNGSRDENVRAAAVQLYKLRKEIRAWSRST